MHLRARPAGPRIARGTPEVVLRAHAHDPAGWNADFALPDLVRLVVLLEYGHPDALLGHLEHLRNVLPGPVDRFLLEIVAEGKIAEIRDHGREVLFVGGTPLYLKALLRGMFDGPPADWEFRQQVEKEIQTVGIEALHQRLEQVDPLAADKLHPNDKRRIIRALEVYKLTGQPISHLQTQFDEDNPTESCKVFVLRWPREVLHERINDRVEQMFAAGFVDEVRGLRERYGELSQTASQAVGYREVIEHLHGERNLEETIGAVKTRTRAFARRQETWFRSLGECRPVQLSDELHAKAVAERIVAEAASSRR
ncbi:MAG: tRNA (adenosine(37)-N6)-dimethylallyltransferase MiaA [Planctomycetes bacterium]|nr:tRNA (adenosine(37)-N6)-dimethylallyltransferase MiaA [Planctomycetota bacterium]